MSNCSLTRALCAPAALAVVTNTRCFISSVQDRIDMTFQLLRQRGQRASLFHGTADGVIPIRQAR